MNLIRAPALNSELNTSYLKLGNRTSLTSWDLVKCSGRSCNKISRGCSSLYMPLQTVQWTTTTTTTPTHDFSWNLSYMSEGGYVTSARKISWAWLIWHLTNWTQIFRILAHQQGTAKIPCIQYWLRQLQCRTWTALLPQNFHKFAWSIINSFK